MELRETKPTPIQRVLNAWNKYSSEDFHKYIYDYGDILLEAERDLIDGNK